MVHEYFRAVENACNNLQPPDKNTSDAVDVRQELDLRIGKNLRHTWAVS